MTTKINIITHDKVVHADDVFAAGILQIIYQKVHVTRTRDLDILRAATGAPNTFLLDVGGRYDAEQRLFDHHQPEGAGFRNAASGEWPYATAGLVWKHYGAQAVRKLHPDLNAESIQEIVTHIDESVVRYIDAVDCGVRIKTAGPSLSALIGSFNPSWFEEDEDVFPLVMNLAQVLLTNFIKRHAGKVMARDKVRASETIHDGQILLLEKCLPWSEVVSNEMPGVLFVVYPVGESEGSRPQWQLRATVNDDMTPRIKLPPQWGGRERTALATVSGENTAVFCHRSRHLAGAETMEGAISMAMTAIEHVAREERLVA
ncbi:short-chain dehydrogenase [Novimethylophilus kurashikiensis]|uniref:Short-chain dehydrogenase n=1 Tax=Novimethylophilus kurashikiensis TaxID=1825523 RepID=A0A2R5F835_9PROT|nr:MYG1 family protein [Novimethylophilus kurashikiensis]GBG14357.1 short-chain dehydrogenase [Novimethylophilus kurashikiensis]